MFDPARNALFECVGKNYCAPKGAAVRIAVIGANEGIALRTAFPKAPTTLYEADPRLGGYTHSHTVLLSDQVYSVDTGFVAQRRIPPLSSWLAKLGVTSQPAQMSLT